MPSSAKTTPLIPTAEINKSTPLNYSLFNLPKTNRRFAKLKRRKDFLERRFILLYRRFSNFLCYRSLEGR